ncbi:MAG: hypothetical protein JXD19_00470 [Deltaproteobacteria bacterium]|nr:hypothetical protein [Deltaproteobacteria bacterium]
MARGRNEGTLAVKLSFRSIVHIEAENEEIVCSRGPIGNADRKCRETGKE